MHKDISLINQSACRYFENKIKKITSFCESSDLPSGIGVYLSKRTERLHNVRHVNHNGKCYFENSGKLIACRHMAHAFAKRYIGTKENNYKQIKQEEDFEKKFNEIGDHYGGEISRAIAHKNYICSFEKVGEVFHVIALKMLESGLSEAPYFIYSENHVMALRFARKDNVIKIDFYDPNDTCSHKNIIFKDLNSLKNIRLKHLISYDYIKLYFSIFSAIHIASLERCDKEKKSQLSILVAANADNLSVAIIYYSLCLGVFHLIENPADAFTALQSIKEFSVAEQNKDNVVINLLQAQNSKSIPGLFMALQSGHAETVMAFIGLILNSNLQDQDKCRLLYAQRGDGTPGFFLALQNGHTKTVMVFAEHILKSNLPDWDRYNLLHALDKSGTSGFFMALQNGHPETVAAFITLILGFGLGNEEKIILLQARRGSTGTSGFFMALAYGHTKTVMVFVSLILKSDLQDPHKSDLLQARSGNSTPGFLIALEKGYQEMVAVFTRLILESNLQELCKHNLLKAQHPDGSSGLFMALQNGHIKTVMDFVCRILNSNLPDLFKHDLLQAQHPHGVSGLFVALQEGHKETAAVFTRLILASNLPKWFKDDLIQTEH